MNDISKFMKQYKLMIVCIIALSVVITICSKNYQIIERYTGMYRNNVLLPPMDSTSFKQIHINQSSENRVHCSNNTIFQTPSDDQLSTITSIYGVDIAKEMLPVSFERDSIKITGFIGKPNIARSDKTYESIFVNKRYIKNKVISQAIFEAFHSLLFSNRYPIAILDIEINPKHIDVNVHPTKREIRISIEQLVYSVVFEEVYET